MEWWPQREGREDVLGFPGNSAEKCGWKQTSCSHVTCSWVCHSDWIYSMQGPLDQIIVQWDNTHQKGNLLSDSDKLPRRSEGMWQVARNQTPGKNTLLLLTLPHDSQVLFTQGTADREGLKIRISLKVSSHCKKWRSVFSYVAVRHLFCNWTFYTLQETAM